MKKWKEDKTAKNWMRQKIEQLDIKKFLFWIQAQPELFICE